MNMWSENPEWFDAWLEEQAARGRFGPRLQRLAEDGDFAGYEYWDKLDRDGQLGQEAMRAFVDHFIR